MHKKKKKTRALWVERGLDIGVSELPKNYRKFEQNTSKKSNKTHCVKNHPWTDQSTYVHEHGRNCRRCNAAAARRYRRRVKRRAVPT
jgi:hypothetical protein